MRFNICAAAALLATPAFAQDQVTYQLDWLPGGDKAPIYVCIHEGFCEDAGLEVSIESGRGSSEAVTKLATGTSDIGSAGIGAVMSAAATEDVPVTVVMSIFTEGPHAFYTLEGNGIESIEDVAGKSIATSPFTESNLFLPLVLADNGVDASDITLTNADPGALGPLLMTGQTDAIIAWLTDVTRYTDQAEEAGREIVVLPWSEAGLELYSAALVASDRFLEDRPEVARRFVDAFQKSIEFALENPEAAADAVAAMVPELGAEDVIGSWTDASALIMNDVTEADGLGTIEDGRLQATWERVSQAQGLDPASLDPETVVDRSFLPGADG
ncbi:ABC transporter substrate-binding protein [Palleronia sp. LCG004]|uniref:ABC transporter substrate-binding protein n=1 Tax=Palleronia sp. LCG004 TaxID=3079304 RepID=UPI0029439454|nr:ABC transporter substrate-binding protein [Palleronia sp. LCG004]WOI55807.1 ABC transporter substrate-binding protein [Palleronia sp. LCG004]